VAGLTLDRVSKTYRPRGRAPVLAVDAMSLDVKDGEIVGLLGSSGCGKTSTLRMIAGFEEVSEGAIRVAEKPVHRLPPARRNVAMAFEGYALYPPLRVRENIGFALLRERRPAREIAERVDAVAELLEITDILNRYPTTISSGQQQRTSLARALIRRAPVSLLDEPMSQLEPQLRAILRARLKDYLIAHRMTTVFVTHDQTEAIALADRIAVMETGVLQQYATPAELKERPTNMFVASFIGEPPMNLVDATIQSTGRGIEVAAFSEAGDAGFRFPLPPVARAQLEAGLGGHRSFRLGIRPHRIALGTAVPGGIAGRVLSNQWIGDQSHLGLEVAGIPIVAVADKPVAAAVGETLPVALPLDALHLFDADSGRALVHGLDGRAQDRQ
jgi:multiple sugar transport system ATP-binding protein